MKRREIIKLLTAAPLAGGIIGSGLPFQSALAETAAKPAERNLFKELGLKTFINASCVCTTLTASLMPEEVTQAIANGAKEFALLDDVQDKVGEKIAAMCHAEAATVTAGCWSALVLGLAGVLTGMDQKKVMQLPKLEGTGMKSEVILQKSHANGYHQALTNTGATLVLVETQAEAEAAINEKTAMLWFLNRELPSGQIKYDGWLALGKKHNIPTMIDIASDAHPVENLWKYNDMGFDLVAISGGKVMGGPQSTGILMGKKHLIAAARLSAPPRSGICRGHKVNKEEIMGLYVAVERHINMDHKKEWKTWEDKMAVVYGAVKDVKGITATVFVPPIANYTPTLDIVLNSDKLTPKQLKERLWMGSPAIEVLGIKGGVQLTVFQLKPGQEQIVAKRLREELQVLA
jgi:seryl-tRNA(Sec) selenium transferase